MQDLHKKWPHRWLSPKAEVRRSSIHGLGVFAKKPISKGEEVGVLGGVIVHQSEIEKYWELMNDVGIQIDENFFVVPTSRGELEKKGVFNHSCEPNLGFSNSITLVAIREIKKGEELVFDYAFSETFRNVMKCQCGSHSCRKKIRSDDWKIEKIRKKYGQFYSPYLRNR